MKLLATGHKQRAKKDEREKEDELFAKHDTIEARIRDGLKELPLDGDVGLEAAFEQFDSLK